MSEYKKLLFIVNPNAGAGRVEEICKRIDRIMLSNGTTYEYFISENEIKARKYILENWKFYERIVAVGGDGTLYATLNALMETGNRKLGIISAGTGNDYAKSLLKRKDLDEQLEELCSARGKIVDVGQCNNNYFLNIASIGYDAEVVVNYNKFKKYKLGQLAYYLSIFYTMIFYKKINMELEIDGKKRVENIVIAALGKGSFYGSGVPIMPLAQVDDGHLHLIIIRDLSNINLFLLFPLLLLKKHHILKKHVQFIKAKEVKFTILKEEDINIDGDIVKIGQNITFKVLKNEINII